MQEKNENIDNITFEQMFGDNLEHLESLKEIVEMHTKCIMKLTENISTLEKRLDFMMTQGE